VENDEYNYTALSYAAYHGRQRIIGYLLAHGAAVNGVVLKSGITYANTPLMMAAIQGHYDVVVELLRAGANPAIREYRGHTAAQFAVKYKHDHIATLLQCAQRTRAIEQMVASCR
jgi:ankyrin repeat protein